MGNIFLVGQFNYCTDHIHKNHSKPENVGGKVGMSRDTDWFIRTDRRAVLKVLDRYNMELTIAIYMYVTLCHCHSRPGSICWQLGYFGDLK